MVLYVNACVRKESRTDVLAKTLLEEIGQPYLERKLREEPLVPLSRQGLDDRMQQLAAKQLDHPAFSYAKEFAAADTIVISAPYWDLSFPALLKVYIETIYIIGIVSRYDANGRPEGLCRAQELYYVTTAGGKYDPQYSFAYIKALCEQSFGISNVKLVMAELLDMVGSNPAEIMQQAKQSCRLAVSQSPEQKTK